MFTRIRHTAHANYVRLMLAAVLLLTGFVPMHLANAQTEEASPFGNRDLAINSGDYYTPPPIYVDEITATQEAGGEYTVNATLYNGGEEVVGGITYRVELLSLEEAPAEANEIINDAPYIYDTQLSNEVLALLPQATKQVSLPYTLPPVAGGQYRLRLQIVTENDRELGWADTTVTAPENPDPYALITAGTIDLPEFPNTSIPPLSGPNVSPNSSFTLRATATSAATAAQSLVPTLEIVNLADPTTVVATTTTTEISLLPGQDQQIDFPVTAPTTPGVYSANLYLARGGVRHSTLAEYHWVVRGKGAEILSARIVQFANTAGESVKIAIDYVGAADAETYTEGTLKIDIVDDQGVAGTFTVPETLNLTDAVAQGLADVPLSRDIVGTPSIQATLTDKTGQVLATYNVTIDLSAEELARVMPESPEQAPVASASLLDNRTVVIAIIGALALLVVILLVVLLMKSRNDNNPMPPSMKPTSMAALMLAFGLLAAGGLWVAHTPSSEAQINVINSDRVSQSIQCKQGDGWCSTPGRLIEVFINQPRHNRPDSPYDRTAIPFQFRISVASCRNGADKPGIIPLYDKSGIFQSTLYGQDAQWVQLPSFRLTAGRCPEFDYFCRLSTTYSGSLNFSELPAGIDQTTLQVQAYSARNQALQGGLQRAINIGHVQVINVWTYLQESTAVTSPTVAPPTPVTPCTDGEDNDGDNRVDADDPACHTGHDINEPYDPTRTSENDTECTDELDNDEDGFENEEDPGCHIDNDINNAYVPGDNSEANIPPLDPGTIIEDD